MAATSDAQRWHPALSVAAVLQAAPEYDDPPVRVEFFTDPFSGWCWGNQPDWHKLCETFGGLLHVRYRLVGLIQGDGAARSGSLSDPARMAMHWEEIAHLTGMPLDSDRWLSSPPQTSWPACAALAAAFDQDPAAGERYLRRLREHALCLGSALQDASDLLDLAKACGLDTQRLGQALEDGRAGELFAQDMRRAAALGGVTCPTYCLTGPTRHVVLRGSRPFGALVDALAQVYDDALPLLADPALVEDRAFYALALAEARGSITAAELALLLEIDPADSADLLDRMSASGKLVRHRAGSGSFYRTP